MKFIKITFWAIATIVFFASCEKLKELVNYDVPIEMEYDFEIPATPVADEISIDPVTLTSDINEQIEKFTNKSGIGKINNVKLTAVSISIPDAYQHATDNLTTLSKLIIQFNSSLKTDWVMLVNLTSPPSEPYFTELPIDQNINYKDYFESNTFNFKATAGVARPTTQAIKATIKIKASVNVSL